MAKAKKKQTDYSKYAIITLVIVLISVLGYAIISMFDTGEPEEGTTVLATVNGEPIYEHDVNKRLKYLRAQQGPQVDQDFALNYTINQRVLLQEADKLGVKIDIEEIIDGIDKWITELQTEMPPDQLDLMLAKQNITLDEFRNDSIELYIENFKAYALLNQTVFQNINNTFNTTVTAKEVKEHFEMNKELYDRVDASHILICFEGTTSCQKNRTKEEAMNLMKSIMEMLKGNGNFEEVAKEYSDGPSGVDGGNLGQFSKGQMVPEFEKAVFALKYPNQLSDIIETDFGFHLIKLNERISDFDSFESEISVQLQMEKQQQAQIKLYELQQETISKYIKELRSQSDIIYYTGKSEPEKLAEQTSDISTFNIKEGEICMEDGKPIIRLFSTTRCPHCNWIKDTFDETVREYEGQIVAYHWEMDSGDNTLTDAVENSLPDSEKNLYLNFNQKMTVPTFIFGCRYYRIGTGYEALNRLDLEKREFKKIIEELIDSPQ